MSIAIKTGFRPAHNRIGNLLQVDLQFNLGSYVTGGVPFDPAKYGSDPRTLTSWNIPPVIDGYSFIYDPTNKLLKAIVIATGAEVANATDLSAVNVRGTFQFGV